MMAIWAISDLHLSFGVKNKPMNIFGENWSGYEEKIIANWRELIREEDTVIMAGDFSWGMYLNETIKDFEFLNNLPGKKILIKGNHDYWWETTTKLNRFISEQKFKNIFFLHNNFFKEGNTAICGTRGWDNEDEELTAEQNIKVANREKERLERSLKLAGDCKDKIAVVHYNIGNDDNYIEIMKKYNVSKCIYGHLHGKIDKSKLNYLKEGIQFVCTSCDLIDFKPVKISL